jgi:RND family efflux transporter MFP subunit
MKHSSRVAIAGLAVRSNRMKQSNAARRNSPGLPSLPYAIFLLLLAVAYSGCSRDTKPAAVSPQAVHNIPTLAVQAKNVPDLLEAVGTVRAAQTSELASQMMGNIVEIRVHEGDRVQRGQILAVIDESQPRAALDRAMAAGTAAQQQLAAANSDLSLAESTLERYRSLYERKSVSPQEFDEINSRRQAALARRDMAQAGQAQAQAAVVQARTSLDYARIRAPFDGVVSEKKADPGTLVAPGMPIFTVEDIRHYRLEATLNEHDLQYARVGQLLPVTIDALGQTDLRGRVVQIVPAADPGSRSFLVKIELPADSRLRSGLFGRVEFARGEHSSLLIPRTAVIERGQLQGVFVLDQNQVASLRYISLGKPFGSEIEVLAGLQPGDRLVAQPGEVDLNGKRVEAR